MKKVSTRDDLQEVLTQVLNEATEVISSAADPANAKPAPSLDIRLAADTVVQAPRCETVFDVETDPFGTIGKIPPDLLAQALETENTRTISLLMNYLDVEIAGQIYKLAPVAAKTQRSVDALHATDDR